MDGRNIAGQAPPRPASLVTACERLNEVYGMLSNLENKSSAIASSIGGEVPTAESGEKSGGPIGEPPLVMGLNALAARLENKARQIGENLERIGRAIG